MMPTSKRSRTGYKLILFLALLAVLVQGCASGGRSTGHPEATGSSDSTGVPSALSGTPLPSHAAGLPQPSADSPAPQEDSQIEMIFAGDAMMDGSVKQEIQRSGADAPWIQVKEEVSRADYAVLNLETSVTDAEDKDLNQTYNFKSDAGALKGIKNAGFDLVSLANNHVMDYKEEGLQDTLQNVEDAGLLHVGAGMDEESAFKFETLKLKGKTIRIGAFSRFMPTLAWNADGDRPGVAGAYDPAKMLAAISEQSQGADYTLIFIHWGVETHTTPEPWQRDLAKDMLDAGASAVIGSHPHVLQGFEFHDGKPIAYSLGNFLFPDYVSGKKADTGMLHLTLEGGGIKLKFQPYFIGDNVIVKRNEAYDAMQLKELERLSFNVKLDHSEFVPNR